MPSQSAECLQSNGRGVGLSFQNAHDEELEKDCSAAMWGYIWGENGVSVEGGRYGMIGCCPFDLFIYEWRFNTGGVLLPAPFAMDAFGPLITSPYEVLVCCVSSSAIFLGGMMLYASIERQFYM